MQVSAKDIRKVVALLSELAHNKPKSMDIFGSSEPALPTTAPTRDNDPEPVSSGGGLFNMFGDSSSSSSSSDDYPTLKEETTEEPEKTSSKVLTY